MKFLADEILADCSQNRQSAKINSPPKFPAIRYTIITYTIDECCLAIISGNVLNQTAVINETHSAEQPRDVCSIVQY